MKWLILLGLIIVLIVIVASRYRQQIKMAVYVWRMFRKMRQASKAEKSQIEKQDNSIAAALVSCAKCGAWIPQNKALNLRSGISYCSRTCLETTANLN